MPIKNTIEKIRTVLEEVYDPEIPVLSIIDLGIVRSIKIKDDITEISITPTYSGCPAMDVIAMNIRLAMASNNVGKVHIRQQLSPAWTTDWMSDSGKQKLRSYGIAPPVQASFNKEDLENKIIHCPLCHSDNTRLISEFGSTSCKALFQCNECREPFDYFKCH